ncbi:glycosyltransferase family 2 protein [Rhodoferax sp. WC2427]|uniref:glycosyltransferase family 2 protein n=1 Tax=Rhodoferax sp. WC2427 TaxID=3234144 RepID=UPI003466E0FC
MHPKLSISVALCTHNGARFIRDQVQSICGQSLLPEQIVVSDDASADHCVELIESTMAEWQQHSQKSVQLKILRNEIPLKVTKNFEQAVMACTGDLIALCDQDDIWHADRLARMAAEFEQRPDLLLLHSNARLVDEQGLGLPGSLFYALEVRPFELEWIHSQRALDVFLRRNLVTGATTIFRRSLLKHALPFPKEWVHDEWLAMVAAAIGGVDVLEQPWIDYRQHTSNQIGARRETLTAKFHKAFALRDNTLGHRAFRIEVLLARLSQCGDTVPAHVLAKLQQKLTHQRFRAALPKQRLARCLPVLREALTGRYNQFGRGLHNIARDLLESA